MPEPPAIGVSCNISSSVVIAHRNANTSDDDSFSKWKLRRDEDEILFSREAIIYLLMRFFKEKLTYVMRFFKEKLTYPKNRL